MNKTRPRPTQKEMIRAIPDGGMLTFPLDGKSTGGLMQRVHECNSEDGWRHYTISWNKKADQAIIFANYPNDHTTGQ